MNDYREQEHSTTLRDYVRVLFKRKWIILSFWVVATVAGFVVLQGQQPTYVSTGEASLIEAGDESLPLVEQFPELFRFNWGTELATWTSRQGADKVIEYLEQEGQLDALLDHWFQDSEWVPPAREGKIEVIANRIHNRDILTIAGKGQLVVIARHSNPHVAKIIASGYLNAIREDYKRKIDNAYTTAAAIFDQEIAKAEVKKASAQAALNTYMEENTPPDVQGVALRAQQFSDKMADARAELTVAQNNVAALQTQLQDFKIALGRADPTLILQSLDATHELATKAQTLRMVYEQIAGLLIEGKSESHPLVRRRAKDRDKLEAEIQSGVQDLLRNDRALEEASYRYAELKRQHAQAVAQVAKAKARVAELESEQTELLAALESAQNKRPMYESQIANLRYPIRAAEESIAKWQGLKDQVQSAAAARGNTDRIVILKPAPLPGRPVNGSWQLQALFVSIAGLILGILAAYALDLLDHSYDRADVVERELGVSVLATFPEEKQT